MTDGPEGRGDSAFGCPRIAGRGGALVRQAQHLAEVAAHVLRRIEFLALTGRQVQETVFAEGDPMREMTITFHFRILAPDDLEILYPRLSLQIERTIAKRRPTGVAFPRLDEADVDTAIAGEIGMGNDVTEAALPRHLDAGSARDGPASAVRDVDQPQPTVLFGEECEVGQADAASRQEIHRPRRVELRDLGNFERRRTRRLRAAVVRARGDRDCAGQDCQ